MQGIWSVFNDAASLYLMDAFSILVSAIKANHNHKVLMIVFPATEYPESATEPEPAF